MPKNHRNYQKTRHIALSGLLFALAMALSFIEGTLVIPGLLPGMKLGLANIVVMYALFFMGPRQALVLDVLKALFVFLVSGFTAGFLSLCGGLLSLAVMWVLYYLLPVRPTWFILSVCGALAHNVGQLLGAGVIISSSLSLYYAPVMLVPGLVMGALGLTGDNLNQEAISDMLSQDRGMIIAMTVFLAPLAEETLFRGGLFCGLYRRGRVLA